MSSVQRRYFNRNNNLTQIVPTYLDTITYDVSGAGGGFDMSGVYLYTLTVQNVQNTGGNYFVDLSGVDMSGNLINASGLYSAVPNLTPPLGGTEIPLVSMIAFFINIPFDASYVPGLEFTIFFKNIPTEFMEGPPLFSIALLNASFPVAPLPYMISPPIPPLVTQFESWNNMSQSVTFKSDGDNFSVVSSGPAGWLGYRIFNLGLLTANV
jgi:hypothetical protein